jgi:hypothetical protein
MEVKSLAAASRFNEKSRRTKIMSNASISPFGGVQFSRRPFKLLVQQLSVIDIPKLLMGNTDEKHDSSLNITRE